MVGRRIKVDDVDVEHGDVILGNIRQDAICCSCDTASVNSGTVVYTTGLQGSLTEGFQLVRVTIMLLTDEATPLVGEGVVNRERLELSPK